MIKTKKVYKLFGFIPVFSVVSFTNTEEIYQEMSTRFSKEFNESLKKNLMR